MKWTDQRVQALEMGACLTVFVGALFVSRCSSSDQQIATKTAQDVCAIIAPETDAGAALVYRMLEDLEQLKARQLGPADAGARDGPRE